MLFGTCSDLYPHVSTCVLSMFKVALLAARVVTSSISIGTSKTPIRRLHDSLSTLPSHVICRAFSELGESGYLCNKIQSSIDLICCWIAQFTKRVRLGPIDSPKLSSKFDISNFDRLYESATRQLTESTSTFGICWILPATRLGRVAESESPSPGIGVPSCATLGAVMVDHRVIGGFQTILP